MPVKALTFLDDSRKVLQALSTNLRRQAGLQPYELQQGHEPDDWKPMATVGMGERAECFVSLEAHIQSDYRAIL